MTRTHLTWSDVDCLAGNVADRIATEFDYNGPVALYGIPRGGVYAVQAVFSCVRRDLTRFCGASIVESPVQANVIVDDIIDTGKTRAAHIHHSARFYALVNKQDHQFKNCGWVTFPWERMNGELGPEENIRRVIEYIGDDPDREGLLETPSRVVRSYAELFSGYAQNPADVIKTFEDGACDEMVIVRDIEFVSFCEHHMLPFTGTAHIAYIPDGKVVGVSKLVRVLEVFARRLQIQERLCQQVTAALDQHLKPKGSACVLVAKHLCMSCRGVGKQHSEMVTSSLTGVFREIGNGARQEFLTLLGGRC